MTTSVTRTLSIILICAMAWLPLFNMASLTCGEDPAQADNHAHHAPSAEVADQNYQVHLCHSVCASCSLFTSSLPVLQFAASHQLDSSISEKVPRLDLPLHERPPRLI